jgi:hypothetical protein
MLGGRGRHESAVHFYLHNTKGTTQMNLHTVQKAYLKSFEDPTGRIQVYQKAGDKPVPKPASACAVEEDFQPKELEYFQQKFVESPASRALQATDLWTDDEFVPISMWVTLHIIRCSKSLFGSNEEYSRRFPDEFNSELLCADYYKYVFVHKCRDGRSLVTSDRPIVELIVDGLYVRCFAKSPEELILFSPVDGVPKFEIPVEDYFNTMVWAFADKFIYSHRRDVPMEKLKHLANKFEMSPVIEG